MLNHGPFITGIGSGITSSVQTPDVILGSTIILRATANASSIVHTSGAIDTWIDTAPSPHNGTSSGTARPTYYPSNLSVGSNDGSLPGLDYVFFDGTTDFIDFLLNLAAPGTTPTFFSLIIRIRIWQNLDRIFSGIGTLSVHILYLTPTSPTIATFNGSGPANDNSGNAVNTWIHVMGTFTNTTGGGSYPNQTGDWLQCGNYLVNNENAGNSSTTGFRIGQDVSGSRFTAMDLYEIILTNVVPDATARNNLTNYYHSIMPAGVAWISDDYNAIAEGDSQTAGNGGGFSITTWPNYLSHPTAKIKIQNVAQGGETTVNTAAQYGTQVATKYNSGTAPIIKNIQLLWIGTNDLVALSTSDPDPAASAAAIYANIQTSTSGWHTAGGKNIVFTIPRGNYVGTRETSRLALNALIRAGRGTDSDEIVELANNGVDGDPIPGTGHTDGVYLLDGFHVSTLVHQTIIGPLVSAAMARI